MIIHVRDVAERATVAFFVHVTQKTLEAILWFAAMFFFFFFHLDSDILCPDGSDNNLTPLRTVVVQFKNDMAFGVW